MTTESPATTTKIRPTGNLVLIQVVDMPKLTEGGLHIPESAKKEKREARVEAIGKEVTDKDEIHVGDVIVYGAYAGDEIEIDGGKFKLLQDKEVLAVVERVG